MTNSLLALATLSVKIVLLGGLAWLQLAFLRRGPASSRSRLCTVALFAIILLAAGEALSPQWMLLVKTPVFTTMATAGRAAGVPRAGSGFSTGYFLLGIWLGGALLMAARAIAGRVALSIVRRKTVLLKQMSDVEVRIGAIETPVLAGVVRPAVLLPESARQWSDAQLQMVLIHELTHFRRGDCWSNALAQILRCLFWFHPVVWLLVSRMSSEQELTCDEAVVAAGHSNHDYASFLLESARNLTSHRMFVCSMAGSGAKSLKQRMARLLEPLPRPAGKWRILTSLAALCAIALFLVTIGPARSQNEPRLDQRIYKVGGDVSQPRVLHKIDPQYTEEGRAGKISGTCTLRIVVTAEGRADDIQVVKSLEPSLDLSAMQAIAQWDFQPGMKDGVPVSTQATVEVNFKLQ